MGTYKFIKDYVSPNAKDTQAKQKDTKYRPTDQQTLQAIVDILFDGNVDNESNITINGLREDFSGKCHFTVINDCVLIDYVDIFHAVYKPVHGENTRRAMGKFIEHFKQLKDKYTIKVISRSIDSSKYSIGIISTPFRIIKDGQDLVHGEIIETNTDFDENEIVGVFINSLIDYNVLIDKHANYHYASIACSEKIATAIVDEGDYSDFSIWNEKGLSTYRGNVFGVCEFGQDSETSFSHQVKFYTIKELLEKGCVVSRLNKNTYAVSGFTDLDDSLIKEYQITRL